jgi:hypothetical protein
MRTAFKEWAVIVDALGRGEQILILRKGGIHEGRGGFKPEHDRFVLFPTRFHQQREGVIERAQTRFDDLSAAWPPDGEVRLEYFAEATRTLWLPDRERALALRGQHLWRDEVVAAKADWGREEGLHAILVRVFRLPKPVTLPVLPSYGGCRSWIQLETDVDVSGAVPVLDDTVFQKQTNRLESLIAV